jgi:MFS transporter, DHA3 family, tetracycline resistance protein
LKQKAYTLYLTYSAVMGLLMTAAFTVNTLYRVIEAHLDPLQLVLVGTALELSVFVFEIPTGIVADVYSRRLSVIIGVFLIGAGFLLEGRLALFVPILLAQILWGTGYTFTSGALNAWITEEIGEDNAGQAFLRGMKYEQQGSFCGVLFGTLLGMVRINLPILASGGMLILFAFYLIRRMPEQGFKPRPRVSQGVFGQMLVTLREGWAVVQRRPVLNNLLWTGVFLGMYSEGLDRLWVAHLLDRFQLPGPEPVVWFGSISALGMLGSAALSGLLDRRVDLQSSLRTAVSVTVSVIMLLGAFLGFIVAGNLWLAIFFFFLISILRQVITPLYTTLVNRHLEPHLRATVLSMSSQVDAIGQIAGGPVAGAVAREVSIQAGLFVSLGQLLPVFIFLLKLVANSRTETMLESSD